MGQYYTAYLKDNNGKETVINSWAYRNAAKLTEHSWIGNTFVDVVCNLITDNPHEIAWVGDYADSVLKNFTDKKNIKELERIFELNRELANNKDKPILIKNIRRKMRRGYLINVTQGIYIDLKKYYKENYTKFMDSALNPLPLLTAVGNGQGGGDYYGINEDYIGSWAFDKIMYSETKPEDYEYAEVEYHFAEY